MAEVHGISDNKAEKPTEITKYDYETSIYWESSRWESMPIPAPEWVPYDYQQNVIDLIDREFRRDGHVTCFLYGPPGKGKSNVPLLLARSYLSTMEQVFFVDTFDPTEPGSSFGIMHRRIGPTKTKPLIVVLEEVDVMVLNMHNQSIKPHEHLRSQLKCKAGWDKWLDSMERGHYKNVILLMTSNKSLDWFNELDPAYFRGKRAGLKIHLS
jgi:hypothetical protein